MKTDLLKFVTAVAGLLGLGAALLCVLALWAAFAAATGRPPPPFFGPLALAGFDPAGAGCLLLVALGFLAARCRRLRRAGRGIAVLGGLGGAAMLIDLSAGTGDIALLLAKLRLAPAGEAAAAGGMETIATAAATLCFGVSGLLMLFRRYGAGQAAAAVGLLPSMASGIASLLGTTAMFGHFAPGVLAATALAGAAILGGSAHRGAIRVFLSRTISGNFGRKQMLVATAAPILLAFVYRRMLPPEEAPRALAETVASIIVIAWITMGATALVGRHLDIRRHRAEAELRNMARHDALTGLLNRRSMNTLLPQRFSRARETGRPISLLMCDLDFFKLLNDEHGHVVGDDVLRRTAERVSAAVRDSDLVFRYGGEEIAVLLDCGAADAQRIAEKIRQAVKEPGRRSGDADLPAVTISIGAASSAGGTTELGQLLAAADECLYAAKDAGRDCVRHMDLP